MNKKERVAVAKANLDLATKVLKANEILWNDTWQAAKNPFEAIATYKSKTERAKRKPIIDAWVSAVAAYELVRPQSQGAA